MSDQKRKDARIGFVGPRKPAQMTALDELITRSVAMTGAAVVEELSSHERRVVYGPKGVAGARFRFVFKAMGTTR